MAELTLFDFAGWVDLQTTAAQASADDPLDFSVGSVPLALVEANTSALLYLQANIVTILALTRATSSFGDDLDTFFADFGFSRLPVVYTTGTALLYRDQATTLLRIPADGSAFLLLGDGSVSYQIVPDSKQAAYDLTTNSYIVPIGQKTTPVTVVATTAGPGGNAPVGTELLTGANVSGIDTATVGAGFQNGAAQENDTAYRARFVLYLASLSRATLTAIESAIANVQTGLTWTIANNQDPAGNFEPGNFVVTIDDGSGSPSDALIAKVDAAVTAYQGNTVSHSTRGPTLLTADITGTVTLAPGSDPTVFVPFLTTTLAAYVNALPLGSDLITARVISLLLDANPAVRNVKDLKINGVAADLVAAKNNTIKAGAIVLNPIVADS